MGREWKSPRPPVLVPLLLLALAACAERKGAEALPSVPGGDPERGRELLFAFGCITCHQIPGVSGVSKHIGPPLEGFARRSYIAGRLPNTADALQRWIINPQEVEPGTAMPALGVKPAEARDMAAYLYTLE